MTKAHAKKLLELIHEYDQAFGPASANVGPVDEVLTVAELKRKLRVRFNLR